MRGVKPVVPLYDSWGCVPEAASECAGPCCAAAEVRTHWSSDTPSDSSCITQYAHNVAILLTMSLLLLKRSRLHSLSCLPALVPCSSHMGSGLLCSGHHCGSK